MQTSVATIVYVSFLVSLVWGTRGDTISQPDEVSEVREPEVYCVESWPCVRECGNTCLKVCDIGVEKRKEVSSVMECWDHSGDGTADSLLKEREAANCPDSAEGVCYLLCYSDCVEDWEEDDKAYSPCYEDCFDDCEHLQDDEHTHVECVKSCATDLDCEPKDTLWIYNVATGDVELHQDDLFEYEGDFAHDGKHNWMLLSNPTPIGLSAGYYHEYESVYVEDQKYVEKDDEEDEYNDEDDEDDEHSSIDAHHRMVNFFLDNDNADTLEDLDETLTQTCALQMTNEMQDRTDFKQFSPTESFQIALHVCREEAVHGPMTASRTPTTPMDCYQMCQVRKAQECAHECPNEKDCECLTKISKCAQGMCGLQCELSRDGTCDRPERSPDNAMHQIGDKRFSPSLGIWVSIVQVYVPHGIYLVQDKFGKLAYEFDPANLRISKHAPGTKEYKDLYSLLPEEHLTEEHEHEDSEPMTVVFHPEKDHGLVTQKKAAGLMNDALAGVATVEHRTLLGKSNSSTCAVAKAKAMMLNSSFSYRNVEAMDAAIHLCAMEDVQGPMSNQKDPESSMACYEMCKVAQESHCIDDKECPPFGTMSECNTCKKDFGDCAESLCGLTCEDNHEASCEDPSPNPTSPLHRVGDEMYSPSLKQMVTLKEIYPRHGMYLVQKNMDGQLAWEFHPNSLSPKNPTRMSEL